MGVERILLKLRYESPALPVRKLVDRLSRRVGKRRRRVRWGHAQTAGDDGRIGQSFSARNAARLWPGAADRSWLAEAVERWPDLHEEASRRAEAAASGRFDLLGSGEVCVLDAAGRIRWHEDFKSGAVFPADCLYLDVPTTLAQEGTDIKAPWELSRFQHVFSWIWTHPQRYGDVFLRQWSDWMEANPVARGVNWACTMDVALRAISWTAAVAAWGQTWDAPTLHRMAAALADHGRFIRDNLEWICGSRTNHYFSDIVGLAVLGAVLDPYPPAVRWSAFAARELRREILSQFGPDGFDKEGSTTYHRLMVELATLGLLACRVAGHDLGEAVRGRLIAAYRAIAALTDSAGNAPLIADNDSGRVFPMAWRQDTQMGWILPLGAAVLGADDSAVGQPPPESALLCGPKMLESYKEHRLPIRGEPARALQDAGLFVLGDRQSHMTIRCGPLSYTLVGSHQHLDQLSITLTVGGLQLLVDPGQFCYTPWPQWRRTFRSTSAHNSLTVDGELECRMFTMGRTAFSIINEARPKLLGWRVAWDNSAFAGQHSGYRRLPGGGDWIRRVSYDAGTRRWTVSDRLALTGRHRVEWRFHLHPQATAERAGEGWRLSRGQSGVMLRHVESPATKVSLEEGWYAPAYGVKVPAPVLVYRTEDSGPVQVSFVLETRPS